MFKYFISIFLVYSSNVLAEENIKIDFKTLDATLQGPIKWSNKDEEYKSIKKEETRLKKPGNNKSNKKSSKVRGDSKLDKPQNNSNNEQKKTESLVEENKSEVVKDVTPEQTNKAENNPIEKGNETTDSKPGVTDNSIGENTSGKMPDLIIEPEKEQDVSNLNAGGEGDINQGSGRFFKGNKVEDEVVKEKVKFVYVSRGAWLIVMIQPYIDALGFEVLKKDSNEITASYIELIRSYSYLCSLIASDDGSEEMLKRIASALSSHRRYISSLKLTWPKKSEQINKHFKDYINATFLKNISDDSVIIPAGSLGANGYIPMDETRNKLDSGDESINVKGLLKKEAKEINDRTERFRNFISGEASP